MRSTVGTLAGHTSNRDFYRDRFLRHVHRLLQLGYEALQASDFVRSEEDDISGELRKQMQYLTEEAPTEKWMRLFAVHDQDPINDVVDEASQLPRRGKRRPKLDFRLVSKRSNPNPRFCVEAKRLYRGDSAARYVDDDGLGAFIGEYYAAGDDAAGMLGYVQTDSVAFWLPKLAEKLALQEATISGPSGSCLMKAQFEQGPEHTYLTRHLRKKNGPLEIFHTFFVFS